MSEIIPALLKPHEACKYLNIGRTKLYDLVSQKKIRVVKLSDKRKGGIRFTREALDRYIELNEKEATYENY